MLYLSFVSMGAVAQTTQESMHDKYWFYRYRLTHEFMKKGLGQCEVPSGYSIPAESAYQQGITDLHFGDGTSFLGNYIGVLATEYDLMNRSGTSINQINRLKEANFANCKSVNSTSINPLYFHLGEEKIPGKRSRNLGIMFSIIGSAFLAGSIAIFSYDSYNTYPVSSYPSILEERTAIIFSGLVAGGCGLVMTGGGITLWVIGQKKLNKQKINSY